MEKRNQQSRKMDVTCVKKQNKKIRKVMIIIKRT